MLFPDTTEHNMQEQARTVYLYENCKSDQKPIMFKIIKKKSNLKEIAKIFKSNTIRVYNSEGSEYFEQDMDFIRNGAVLYVSKGEEFDPASCFAQYEMIQLLGEGGFGKVFLAEHKQTKEKFAIKIIKTQNIGSVNDIDSIFVEAEILKSLRHQNIVKVHKCLTMRNMEVVIIMEYLQGGDLLKYVSNFHLLDEQTSCLFIRQVVRGMLYCHKRNLTHRDLKLQNILLVNSEEKKIKIIDFGIAGAISSMKVQQLDTGSLGYMAPECFIAQKNYKFDGKIDVWAIGVILYAMLNGQMPFKGSNPFQTIELIKQARFKMNLMKQRSVSIQCLDFLKKCLEPDPKMRISIEELNNHQWLSEGIFSHENNKEHQCFVIDPVVQQKPESVQKFKQISNLSVSEGPEPKKKEKSSSKFSSKASQKSPGKAKVILSRVEQPKSKFR